MPSLLVAWSTWLALSLVYAYQVIERIIPNVIMQDIMDKYHVGADEIGYFAGIYYIGYVAMHIPMGIIMEQFNVKKVMPIFVFLTVLGFVPLVYSDNFMLTTYGRLLIGLFSAGTTVGAFKMLRLTFSEEKFPRMLGWMVTIGFVGAVFGSGPLTALVDYLGLVNALNYILGLGLILTVLSYFALPNTKPAQSFSFTAIKDDFKYLVSNKTVLFVSSLGGLMIGPMEGFADAWSSPYLRTVYQLTNQEAGDVTLYAYIGMAMGLMIMGYIFEKTKSYYGLIIVSAISMLGCFTVMLMGVVENIYILKTTFLIMGFFCSYQILIVSKSIALSIAKYATFIAAAANMIMMGFGYFFHVGIGKILHNSWDGVLINDMGSPIYSAESFSRAFVALPVSLMVAIVGFGILAYIEKRNKKISI